MMSIERRQLNKLLDTMMEYQKSLIEKSGMSRQSWELLDRVRESIAETKDRRNEIDMERQNAPVETSGGR
jgi:hypothetical protein